MFQNLVFVMSEQMHVFALSYQLPMAWSSMTVAWIANFVLQRVSDVISE